MPARQELDLVAINTLSLAAANVALVWMVSPDRSFGAPHKMPWQKFVHSLPNNVFDACAPPSSHQEGRRVCNLCTARRL